MKRLVFFFDGTWQKLADRPTNVVLTAASLKRQTDDGTVQIIHYDEGVGTGPDDEKSGGWFGAGLLENVREAFRFLIFNYDAGDEIFVFGFSRGAFSARTFLGFIRYVGPLNRPHVDRIDEALKLYVQRLENVPGARERMAEFRSKYSSSVCISPDDEDYRVKYVKGYVPGRAPLMSIKYLGVWDTVRTLGLGDPARLLFKELPIAKKWAAENDYHDVELTDFVESARHAVAIDERRVLFPCELWDNVAELNAARDVDPNSLTAPYQQKWFPGVHGSVGGGGDIQGLSDGALAWIINGAKLAGLVLDKSYGTRIFGFRRDPFAPLENMRRPDRGITHAIKDDRPGPRHLWEVSLPAIRRWHASPASLPEQVPYRPPTLANVADALDAFPLEQITDSDVPIRCQHLVRNEDTLWGLAVEYYNNPVLADVIYQANRQIIDDPNDLDPGWTLRIPEIETAVA